MAKIEFDKKLVSKKMHKPIVNNNGNVSVKRKGKISKVILGKGNEVRISGWNFIYAFLLFSLVFFVLIINLVKLQVVQGEEMLTRSKDNKVRITSVDAFRGVIFDSKGQKLVENVSSVNVYLLLEKYYKEDGLDNQGIEDTLDTLGGILGDSWKQTESDGTKYTSLSDRVFSIYKKEEYTNKILLASDISNDLVIKIKAMGDSLEGVTLDNGNKRRYLEGEIFSHLLGYTSEASENDLEKYPHLTVGDIVGKSGVEKFYENQLKGTKGKIAQEIDVFGRSVSNTQYTLSKPVSGKSLYLSINSDIQKEMYRVLKDAVDNNSAAGGAGVIEDVNSGEILAIVSYPSYDNNLFVNGISQNEYDKLIKDRRNPLLDRSIAAQIPPGSTFKTIVAAAGLEAGVINKNSKYISRTGYTFSNGAPFQEFRNHSYGTLSVTDALMVSSNIFFCEMIRDWSMNELVKYLEAFGIGQSTGIDIPGEMPGRMPSPENKKILSQTSSPWLEEIWYPEGDSCNSVIGQGITLVTPIQMSNWIAAIANGGTLHTPHIAKKFVDENGFEYEIEHKPLREEIVSQNSLDVVKQGMWEVVYGSRGIAKSLGSTGTVVAAKTGTAEFGKLNSKGVYEDTHAWAAGFFPYKNPKYSFSILLEDGGSSSNSVAAIKQLITWMVANGFVE
ncbi:penicillin-binding protein 2 [Candidatus Dojkabacteria bacterium]|uniref:Penicillin-binding protein 2 n=1 Tax=Candidatus Dojkabacteria bacterium TaxID=2099670 RepID=A0A847EU88_9BACT|nr:penicillin-binding protein 2 [Candidatus Dojkabacteria bacterium]